MAALAALEGSELEGARRRARAAVAARDGEDAAQEALRRGSAAQPRARAASSPRSAGARSPSSEAPALLGAARVRGASGSSDPSAAAAPLLYRERERLAGESSPRSAGSRSPSKGGARGPTSEAHALVAAARARGASGSGDSTAGAAAASRERDRRREQQLRAAHEATARRRERLFVALLLPVLVPYAVLLWLMYWQSRRASKPLAAVLDRPAFQELLLVWAFHHLGLRNDPVGARLFAALPGARAAVLLALRWHLRIARWLSGWRVAHEVDTRARGAAARTMSSLAFMDDCLRASRVEQVVVLGGGLRSLALRAATTLAAPGAGHGAASPTHAAAAAAAATAAAATAAAAAAATLSVAAAGGAPLEAFELNDRATHKAKLALLKAAGIEVPARVHFVSTSRAALLGEDGDWLYELEAAGLRLDRSTLFVAHGVLHLVEPAVAQRVLRDVGALMRDVRRHRRTRLALSYLDESKVRQRQASALATWLSGPLRFGLPDGRAEQWVRQFGPLDLLVHLRIEPDKAGFMLIASEKDDTGW